jgi:hypothetical protein
MAGTIRRYRTARLAAVLVATCGIGAPGEGADAGAADGSVNLTAAAHPSDVLVEVELEVEGNLKLQEAGSAVSLPLDATATLRFRESVMPGAGQRVLRSKRAYSEASSTIRVDGGETELELAVQHAAIGAYADENGVTLVSLHGPLTRDELDLISAPADSLVLAGLLPGRSVAVGETWEHTHQAVAALLGLDGVSQTDTSSVLASVAEGAARIDLAGTVHGAVHGIATQIELKGRYEFDLARGVVSRFTLLIKENREPGHVEPGVDIVARVRVAQSDVHGEGASPLDQVELPDDLPQELTALVYQSEQGYRFLYERRWHVVQVEPQGAAVLRLMDRGELVAQCIVTPLRKAEPDRLPGLAKFQKDIQKSLQQNLQQFLSTSEYEPAPDAKLFHVVAAGTASEVPMQWIYYLLQRRDGRMVVCSFTIEAAMAERFGDADQRLVETLSIEPPAEEAVAGSQGAKASR